MSKLVPICVKTLKGGMEKVTRLVEACIAAEMPKLFGLCLDRWTDGSNHFCGIFATYMVGDDVVCPLLAMSPLLEVDRLDADAHIDFIDATLEIYGKQKSDIAFLTADNCTTNASIASKLGVPLVGCYSHKFNLAMKAYLLDFEVDLDSVHAIMLRLGRLRCSGELQRFTDLKPVTRNVTWWSSVYTMLKRYFELLPMLPKCSSLRDILLTRGQNIRLEKLFASLEQLEAVTKRLQAKDLDMADARTMFDGLHSLHPSLPHLAQDAPITRNPDFDSGVSKVLALREDELTEKEKRAVEMFLLQPGASARPLDEEVSFVDELLAPKRRRMENYASNYCCLKFVLPTSNIVERLFSLAKFILTDSRKHMHPVNFEMIVFLKVNSSYWGVNSFSSYGT